MSCLTQKITCLVFFFLSGINSLAQADYNCRHYQNMQGLSYNAVMCLFQDRKGFIWIGTKNGLNRFDGSDFKVYLRGKNNSGLPNSIINDLAETSDGNIWVATDKGLSIYNPEKDHFKTFLANTQGGEAVHDYVHSVDVDLLGNVWIVSGTGSYIYSRDNKLQSIKDRIKVYNNSSPSLVSIGKSGEVYLSYAYNGIIRYDPRNRHYEQVAKVKFPISVIEEYDDNNILVGSIQGLYKINCVTGETAKVTLSDQRYENVYVRTIEKTDEGTFWIGTESGVYIYTDKVVQHLTHSLYNNSYLSDNAIYAIKKDKDGGIWIGSYFGGVDYFPKQDTSFKNYRPEFNRNSISGSRIRSFAYDTENNLWIGTEDNGLDVKIATTGEFRHLSEIGGVNISKINIQCLRIIDGNLWIGTFNKGILVYDIVAKKTSHYYVQEKPGAIPNNDIFAIYSDSNGNIWIGSSSGFYKFDKQKRNFIIQSKFNNFFVSDINEDRYGNLWVATYNRGVVRYNYKKDVFDLFKYSATDTTSLCYDRITYIFRDSKNRMWFASEDGGICLYHYDTETFERFDVSNGLPSNSVYCIQEDNNHLLWLSSNNGLATFNPNKKAITALYGVANGLPTRQFNYTSGIKSSDGKILFGSILGYVELNPEKFYIHAESKPVVLTGFSIFNNETVIGENGILDTNTYYAKEIKLNYRQNTFTINFSTLDFSNEGKGIYTYKLEGFDKQWNYITDANKVSYHNIPPGSYTFRILHMNSRNDTNGKETTITIIVSPPFWRSFLAYIIYLVLAIIIIYLIWKKISHDRNEKQSQQKKQQQIEQEERIYQEKINFFISIAHEIRTPVTLIKAPLEYLINSSPTRKELNDNLSIIGRNTERLQNLINQLLDFRKVESESFRLQMELVNVKELLQSVLIRFEPTASQYGINVSLECKESNLFAQIDKEAVTKIISNLLTNAMKYGETYINIQLSRLVDRQIMRLIVRNDGERIPSEMSEKIFDAFVQLDTKNYIAQGTGLGLALTKSLVDLHSGTIHIDKTASDNCFVVDIPLNMKPKDEPRVTTVIEEEQYTGGIVDFVPEKKSTLLVVEDDLDLRSYLVSQLRKKYKVIEANNGKIAFNIVSDHEISLVLSDIVMPEMTGLELCSALKSNIATCNIPIILLTAKATLTDKIEGLENGADAYIEKPFSMNHLITQINSLIDNRKKMRQNFASDPLHAFNDIGNDDSVRNFIEIITHLITDNIQNEDFNVDTLSEAVNMSRSSLHRKLKTITGQTPNELIRIVRMNKAAELLSSGDYRINEVCERIGIQSLSYFSKTFTKQFGIRPKDFAQKKT